MMSAQTFFSDQDKAAISQTVETVEKRTAGEIAVMVVDQSDEYPEATLTAGCVVGGLLALLLTDLFYDDALWIGTFLFIVFSIACSWLSRFVPAIKRVFVSQTRKEEQVRQRALSAFYDRGLYKTRDETGVLFFLSLFERKVWVLADKGIYQKIDQHTLQAYAQEVAAGIRTGQAATALCRQIKAVGEILAEHFPIKDDDTNELSNKVIIGSS